MKQVIVKIILFATILSAIIGSVSTCKSYKGKYEQAIALQKDYEVTTQHNQNEIRQLQMTNNQLNSSKDSINQLLVEARKNMGIKEKKVTEYIYLKERVADTFLVNVKDSIFIQDLDTNITLNPYSKLALHIDAPSTIAIEPNIVSEKAMIMSYGKEYVNTPSKVFFIRWFQKKRKYIKVDVEEKNPIIKMEQSRFIQTIN